MAELWRTAFPYSLFPPNNCATGNPRTPDDLSAGPKLVVIERRSAWHEWTTMPEEINRELLTFLPAKKK